MAKCAVCGKSQSNGNKLSITRSHISKRSPRTWKPNLRSVKAEVDGEVKRISVCAKCKRPLYAVFFNLLFQKLILQILAKTLELFLQL